MCHCGASARLKLQYDEVKLKSSAVGLKITATEENTF